MKATVRRCDLLNIRSPKSNRTCFMAVNKELGKFLSLPGDEKRKKAQYEVGMKMKMFQFIFLSMDFHYGGK